MKPAFLKLLQLSVSILFCFAYIPLSNGAESLSAGQINLQTSSLPFSNNSSANSILSADDAFTMSALIQLPNTVVLIWDIKQGYYLYKKSLKFIETTNNFLEDPQIPDGVMINDEFFGDVEVFYDRLIINIPFNNDSTTTNGSSTNISLNVNFQGCAEIGFCYPVQQKNIALALP